MTDVTLKAVLLGEDKTMSRSMDKAGNSVENVGKKSKIAGGVMKGALAAGFIEKAADAVIDFGQSSIEAYRGATASQLQLQDAYRRFPALADVNIGKMRELATAIEKKTGADADDIASGQAVLARYRLTGTQLRKLTPLLVDYATRTGKDIPSAAKALGKSLTGSSRLSKELGFKFKDTKTSAGNLKQVMAGLRATVGGYANKEAKTAAGQSKILNTQFGNLQETIGKRLEPSMKKLTKTGIHLFDWLDKNPEVIDLFVGDWGTALENTQKEFNWFGKTASQAVEFVASHFADLLDMMGNIPGFGKAKEWAANLRTVAKGAHDTVLQLSGIAKQKIAVKVDPAVKSVGSLKKAISSIKGKIVQAKAKGDTKELDRLNSKLRSMRKQYSIAVRVYKTGIRRITVALIRGGAAGAAIGAFAQGGRPPKGKPSIVGENGWEVFVPDSAGRILNQRQLAQKPALASAITGGSSGGGDTYIINAPPGAPLSFAKAVEVELVKLKQSRGGGGNLRFQRG